MTAVGPTNLLSRPRSGQRYMARSIKHASVEPKPDRSLHASLAFPWPSTKQRLTTKRVETATYSTPPQNNTGERKDHSFARRLLLCHRSHRVTTLLNTTHTNQGACTYAPGGSVSRAHNQRITSSTSGAARRRTDAVIGRMQQDQQHAECTV